METTSVNSAGNGDKEASSSRRESLDAGYSTFEKTSMLGPMPGPSEVILPRRTPRDTKDGHEFNTSISSLLIGTGASRSRNKTLDLLTWFGLPQSEVSKGHCLARGSW